MKKILLLITVSAALLNCKKQETQISENASEHHSQTENKNEMVGLMDEMMDEMHSEKPVGNNDADFAKMMIEHHKGTVEMSEFLLKKGENEELKNFAQKVISAQNKEIDLMKRFENEKTISENHKEFQQGLNQSMAAMMDKKIKIHNDIDKDFAQQMIPHHQSAVEMAKVYLKFGKEKELLQLCENIVREQSLEITQLQNWLSKK